MREKFANWHFFRQAKSKFLVNLFRVEGVKHKFPIHYDLFSPDEITLAHPVIIGLNKKLDPKQKTIQAFNTNAKEFKKIEN